MVLVRVFLSLSYPAPHEPLPSAELRSLPSSGPLSEDETRDIRQTARLHREMQEYQLEVEKEIRTEMLRRKLMENREVSADEVEESVRRRIRARYELEYDASKTPSEEYPLAAAVNNVYTAVVGWLHQTQRDHPGLVTTVLVLTVLTMLVWGGTAGAMGHARALENAVAAAAAGGSSQSALDA